MAEIKIESVVKTFGDTNAVNNVSLTVHDQEFLVLLGPSGCGKTTLLRTIAGLGMATSGRISIDGRDVTYLPPAQRKISMVFQSYAIFPHMTVRDNIGFGLKMHKVDKTEDSAPGRRGFRASPYREPARPSPERHERRSTAAGCGRKGSGDAGRSSPDGRAAQQP